MLSKSNVVKNFNWICEKMCDKNAMEKKFEMIIR